MGWEERLKEAAYTPPSGTRLTFDFEDVSRESDKKTTAFTFPDKDGAFVQDLGLGGRRYPLRVFFWGDNYDQESQDFFDALEETGGGILEHPRYGRKEVVPFGTIRQRDDLKTAANQAIIEIIFWESITDLTFPTPSTDAATALGAEISAYSITAPGQFDDSLAITSSGESVGFQDKFTTGLTVARSALGNVAAASADISRQFDALFENIDSNIEELVLDPVRLAQESIALTRLPVQAAAKVGDKLQSYRDLVTTLTSTVFIPSFDNQPQNAFIGAELLATAAHIALIESTLESTFISKPEAISAADIILDSLAAVTAWADESRDALGLVDTGETYQTIINATAIAAGRLVEISFSLLQERIITLPAARTFIDLVAELYGELDEQYDFAITSNNLVGTELLEIPAGREIRYYE